MNISTKITINGHTYHSVDEMPRDVRDQYQKAMAAMRELGAADTGKALSLDASIVFNGKRYGSREELPPEIQALLAQQPSAADHKTGLKIETVKTFRTFNRGSTVDERLLESGERRAPEEDPVVAWLLVKILAIIVLVLLFLLGAKHFWS